MLNKIDTVVYCVIGNSKNYYVEQFIVSLWSLKYYNPQILVKVISDKSTNNYIHENFPSVINFISEEIIVDFNSKTSEAYRSRFIKTNLLKLLKSDFLFLDTDTIVLKSFDKVLDFNEDIGAVTDLHQTSLQTCRYLNWLHDQVAKIGWTHFNLNMPYYNSGVLLVRNTEKSKVFFETWHKNWLYSYTKGVAQDQLALNYTNTVFPSITTLSPLLHCQILGNGLKYFTNAFIIHYFNSSSSDNRDVKPFFLMENESLQKIRKQKNIPEEIKDQIIRKDFFPSQIDLITGENINIFYSSFYKIISTFYRKFPKSFKLFDSLLYRIFKKN